MAPAQVIETKDLPPELTASASAPAPVAREAIEAGAIATPAVVAESASPHSDDWLAGLEREALGLLQSGAPDAWDTLTRQFEARLIRAALAVTRGRRIEAAQKLGIGRNTITRKIQELGLEE